MRKIDLGWIRIFVEVGHRGSLSDAAKALNLTQPAVSYQIRRAEREFGLPLVRRLHRGVELTEAGGTLFDILSGSVQRIDELAARTRGGTKIRSLRLYTDYAFSALWLIPRIHRFSQANPDIDIHIVASQRTDPPQPGDLAVLFGARDNFGPTATLLMQERVVPVCAPAFAQRHKSSEFEGLRLIHLDSSSPSHWFDWRRYLASIDRQVELANDVGSLRLNTYSLVVDAAVAAQGLALGWCGLIDGHLERGLLVEFGVEISAPDRGYFLVSNSDEGPETQRLREWLLHELGV